MTDKKTIKFAENIYSMVFLMYLKQNTKKFGFDEAIKAHRLWLLVFLFLV